MSVHPERDASGKITGWRVRVYVGIDPKTGKKRMVDRIAPTEREAKRLEAAIRQQFAMNTWVPPAKEKLGDFLNQWLETEARPNTRPGTFRRYEEMVRLRINPYLGQVPLSKLTPRHVAMLLARLHQEGLSDRTRLYVYRTLHRALQVAVEWNLMGRNVCDAVRPPKVRETLPVGLSRAQVDRFLAVARQHRLYPLWLMALHTGLRRGELFGLRWEDLNLEEGYLVVQRSMDAKGNLGPPKSGAGRVVPLSPEVVQALRQWRVEQEIERATVEGYQDTGFVFTHPDGRPWNPHNTANRTFKALLKKAGLPPTTRLHDLRHTFASRSLAAGAHPRAVSEILGHHDPGFTVRRYAHALGEDAKDAVKRLQSYLRGNGGDLVGSDSDEAGGEEAANP